MKPATIEQKLESFRRILNIMDELREQCPWDRKQTIESLRLLTIEETFELADAITKMDMQGIREELGDLLLHIVFYARMGEEQNVFDISSIIEELCEKLIRRHPHIYADVTVDNEEDVKRNWEQIKLREKKDQSVLAGVPRSLPALPKSIRIQDKAKKVGFEWDRIDQVYEKVEEELQELKEAVQQNDRENIEKEFGDVLFALANYSRFLNIDAEGALDKTNMKFIQRFQAMEQLARQRNQQLELLTLEEMDEMWNEVKVDFP